MKMASDGNNPNVEGASLASFCEDWQHRILIPTILGGVIGGGVGLMSKHRKVHGLANISATYATNMTIVSGCYCGAREFVRVTRKSDSGDMLNSTIAGFGTGAVLGRLQGGLRGAYRYPVIFAIVGTVVDYATIKLIRPSSSSSSSSLSSTWLKEKRSGWFKMPEWSPIQVLDEEALAEKQARENKVYVQRIHGKLGKEE